MMRSEPWTRAAPGVLELEVDDELFLDPMEAPGLLAGSEASLDDIEPWQRLGDIIGQVTGEAEAD